MKYRIQLKVLLIITTLYLNLLTIACAEISTEDETAAQGSTFFDGSICPVLSCSLYCEDGFKVSSDGCDICACEENNSHDLENDNDNPNTGSPSDTGDVTNPNDDSGMVFDEDAGTISIEAPPEMNTEDNQDAETIGVEGNMDDGAGSNEEDAGPPPPDDQDCIQVQQPALSPSDYCVIFPTPCEVPDEWTPVDSCD